MWPSVIPEVEEHVDYAGFPEVLVHTRNDPTSERTTLHLRMINFGSPVSAVAEDGVFWTNLSLSSSPNPRIRDIEPDGMSGGPAFVYRTDEATGVVIPFLVGVVREGRRIGEILSTVFSPVAAIDMDGRIVEGQGLAYGRGRLVFPPGWPEVPAYPVLTDLDAPDLDPGVPPPGRPESVD